MMHTLRVVMTTLAGLSIIGCAAQPRTAVVQPPLTADLSAMGRYYEQATEPHQRAVRKPVRDRRALALRMLAREADTLLSETHAWDSDVRLAALAEGERPAACDAVASFRAALSDLRAAAKQRDLGAVQQQYPRVVAAYSRLSGTTGPPN